MKVNNALLKRRNLIRHPNDVRAAKYVFGRAKECPGQELVIKISNMVAVTKRTSVGPIAMSLVLLVGKMSKKDIIFCSIYS